MYFLPADYPVSVGRYRLVSQALGVLSIGLLVAGCQVPAESQMSEPDVIVLETPTPPPTPELELPEPVDPEEELRLRLESEIDELTLRDKVSGMLVVTLAGMSPENFRSFAENTPVAGFLLLRNNLLGGQDTIRAFIDSVQEGQDYPLLMSVDQEGSPIARIPGDQGPGARELGRGPLEATTAAFVERQGFVERAGANVNYGVVADVSPGSGAYIHNRSFGTDPALVSQHVVAALQAENEDVAQTIKHFPGHGLVFEDTHKEIASTSMGLDEWRATHALPFQAGLAEDPELIMMAHVRVLSVSVDPASLSDDWVGILRGELGYDGVIITDDLGMLQDSGEDAYQDLAQVAVSALVAGNDLIMVAVSQGEDPDFSTYSAIVDSLVAAVESGLVSEEQVDESLLRVLLLRDSLR